MRPTVHEAVSICLGKETGVQIRLGSSQPRYCRQACVLGLQTAGHISAPQHRRATSRPPRHRGASPGRWAQRLRTRDHWRMRKRRSDSPAVSTLVPGTERAQETPAPTLGIAVTQHDREPESHSGQVTCPRSRRAGATPEPGATGLCPFPAGGEHSGPSRTSPPPRADRWGATWSVSPRGDVTGSLGRPEPPRPHGCSS